MRARVGEGRRTVELVAAVEVGIADDLLDEFRSDFFLIELAATWIGDVAGSIAD